jgi:hypothetical protein
MRGPVVDQRAAHRDGCNDVDTTIHQGAPPMVACWFVAVGALRCAARILMARSVVAAGAGGS